MKNKLKFKIKSDGYLQIGYSENGKWILEEHCGNAEWVLRLVRLSKSMLSHIDQKSSKTKKMDILENKISLRNEAIDQNISLD
jgi:hypothetical protein